MSNQTNDGGPAFARSQFSQPDANKQHWSYDPGAPGMTLRDYFAAKAMAAIIWNSHIAQLLHELKQMMGSDEERNNFDTEVLPKVNAAFAYGQADAMLAEREKGSK